MPRTALLWFRRDLRLADNEALSEAVAHATAVVPVFILPDGQSDAAWHGTGSAAWLARSLAELDASLRALGSRLIVRSGPAVGALSELARECRASQVYCTRDWSPTDLAHEQRVRRDLRELHVALEIAEGAHLVQPDRLSPSSGAEAYRVFAPYHSAWERQWGVLDPLPAPTRIPAPLRWSTSEPLPTPPNPGPDPTREWRPGESGARARLHAFIEDGVAGYPVTRDIPGVDGTSRLSPHLAFGEISPRQVVSALTAAAIDCDVERTFLRQLAWRDFSAHVLHHNPGMLTEPLRTEFANMPWREEPDLFDRWSNGTTGYPLADAGMRQLAATGWMHNRVRMVVASLLTKHLLVHWREGLAHFADLLTDHQPSVNAFNWQWVAGSGADAAPYFRIFNPTLQASRHDPDGAYIRRWVPELADVPARWIARPWEMPADEARGAGLVIGETYPAPIIEHAEAHRRAMAAYAAIKG